MSGARILLVDDDAALLQALPEALHLRLPELVVDTCDEALEALRRIAEVDYDAIISDIKMPGMDGLALLERVHAIRPSTPTLLITGHGEDELAIQALRGGAYDFVKKPIDRDYFMASLARAVQMRQLSRQVEQQRLDLERHAASLEQKIAERTHELVVANRAKDKLLRQRDQALEEARAAAARLEVLQRVTDTALTHLDLHNLLSELLARVRGALRADVVAILLLNEAGTALRVRASIGLEQAVAAGEEIALDADVIGQATERRQPFIVDDLTEMPELIPGLREQARSLVAAPLLVESRAIGVICCGARAIGAYTHDDAQLLRLAADRIALALDHARLYQEVQEAMRDQRVARLRVEELATQLGNQAAELGAIIEAMADGVFVCDPSARITRLNKAASTLLGLPVGAATGLTVADMGEMVQLRAGDGEPLAQADIPLLCALRGETRTDLLTAITQVRTGTEVRLRISSAPIRDQLGNIVGAVAVSRDVTELDRLERQKDEFLSVASHELKTPLTSLKGLAQITRRRLERGGHTEAAHLAGMERAIVRMELLVNDLLDISRIESGKLALRTERADLKALCRQVVEEQVAATNRSVQLDLPGKAILVDLDPDRISQVLTNVLSNAFKYSPTDQPVTLRLQQTADEVRVAITDRGPGIPRAEMPHLFERFYRVPGIDVQAGSGVGLGLGLYISHEIMERHGGRIGVENNPDGGATFTLALPMTARLRRVSLPLKVGNSARE
jgi:PAS domain S-box-containing protein